MPTALVVQGVRFFFYSNDLIEPIHVHAETSDGTAKVWLSPEVRLAKAVGLTDTELNKVLKLAQQHRATLEEIWHDFASRTT